MKPTRNLWLWKSQVNGFSKACFKGFSTQGEAQVFLGDVKGTEEAEQAAETAEGGAAPVETAAEVAGGTIEATVGLPSKSLHSMLTASANQQQVADPVALYRLVSFKVVLQSLPK